MVHRAGQVNQRRYEALRAFFVDGLSHAEAGARFGYTRWAMVKPGARAPGRAVGAVHPAPQAWPPRPGRPRPRTAAAE
jgi:hypothetical protein